jgi:hypothetical protein
LRLLPVALAVQPARSGQPRQAAPKVTLPARLIVRVTPAGQVAVSELWSMALHDRQPVVEPPAGVTFLLGDVYPPEVSTPEERIAAFENGPTRGLYNVINVNAHYKGGHFVHYENPEGDVRETFRRAR